MSALTAAELVLAGAELVNLGIKPVLARAELVDSDTKLSNNRPKLIIARRGLCRLGEFPQQRHEYDARHSEHGLRRGDRKAQPRRRGHLHVAGALERAVEFERRADGLGRILRGVALNRELLGGRRFGLVKAAEDFLLFYY